ncbi:hypothetical protein Hjap01_04046 [Haloarcula japonica]
MWSEDLTQPRVTYTITDDGKRRACKQALAVQGYEVIICDQQRYSTT